MSQRCFFTMLKSLLPYCLVATMFGLPAAQAQKRQVEFSDNGNPVAPSGLENQPLGEGPFEFATAEGMNVRVVVLARGIELPTSLAFPSADEILVATRTGKIRLIEKGQLLPDPVQGAPEALFRGISGQVGAIHGYIDIILHPDFADNRLIYLSYTKPLGEDRHTSLAVGRGRWEDGELKDFTDIWVDGSLYGPGRMTFGRDGKLYVTTNGADPQSLSHIGGKVIRLNDDGSVPEDNPFVGRGDTRPEIYSYGHRGALGLALNPFTGEIWQNENGPNGGDEINIIKPGLNYGWPLVSLGRTYPGPWQAGDGPTHEGFEPPVAYWMPAIAVSGMTFYTGNALPKWKGDVFVGALRTGEIPGTGHIERILFNDNWEELRREYLLFGMGQRIRDIRQGPDELIYAVTDQTDGAVLRIEPAD